MACISKHQAHEHYPITQVELYHALHEDTSELKRRTQLLQAHETFLAQVVEREAATQAEAKTLFASVQQLYEAWLEQNHRCFENLLEALREETALLLKSPESKASDLTRMLLDKQSFLDAEDGKKFAHIPEIEALLTLSKHCKQACSMTQRVCQAEYEEEVLRSFTTVPPIQEKSESDNDVMEVPDYFEPTNQKMLAALGSYADEDDESELIKRGPVPVEGGIYTGQWNLRNERHGYGTFVTENGDLYEGHWRNDQRSGKGRQIYSEDERAYVGYWTQNRREEPGIIWFLHDDELSEAYGISVGESGELQDRNFTRIGRANRRRRRGGFRHRAGALTRYPRDSPTLQHSEAPVPAPIPSVSRLQEDVEKAPNLRDKKQILGEFLYPQITDLTNGTIAGKVTGMLLEMEIPELINLSKDANLLRRRVSEALEVLRNAWAGDESQKKYMPLLVLKDS